MSSARPSPSSSPSPPWPASYSRESSSPAEASTSPSPPARATQPRLHSRTPSPASRRTTTRTRHGRRLVVAFVAGTHGTVASDLLAPYDIFASSPAFTTYVVADAADPGTPRRRPGPRADAHVRRRRRRPRPDARPGRRARPHQAHRRQRSSLARPGWPTSTTHGAKVLGVCSGAIVLAATGMLDGLDATSHWSRISALEKSRPAVHWMRGRRYVEDGSVTTTAAVTSGVPAALHLVAELAGPAEAQRVADLHPELHWTPTRATTIAADHFAVGDWPVGLNFVMPWFRPTVGIALTRRRRRAGRHRSVRGLHPVRGRPHRRPRRRATRSAPGTAWCCSPPATPDAPGCPVSSSPARQPSSHRPAAPRLGPRPVD